MRGQKGGSEDKIILDKEATENQIMGFVEEAQDHLAYHIREGAHILQDKAAQVIPHVKWLIEERMKDLSAEVASLSKSLEALPIFTGLGERLDTVEADIKKLATLAELEALRVENQKQDALITNQARLIAGLTKRIDALEQKEAAHLKTRVDEQQAMIQALYGRIQLLETTPQPE